jgi:hypothetical protein
MPLKRGFLRIQSQGEVPVEDVTEFLVALGAAYEGIAAFERAIDLFTRRDGPWNTRFGPFPPFLLLTGIVPAGRRRSSSASQWLDLSRDAAPPLVLQSVRLESPGEWIFLGAANALGVLRKYLNDRHERRRDREYREPAARERLRLENEILENEVLSGQIRNLKEMGVTTEDLRPLVRQLAVRPLVSLGRQQDRGMIQGATGDGDDTSRE